MNEKTAGSWERKKRRAGKHTRKVDRKGANMIYRNREREEIEIDIRVNESTNEGREMRGRGEKKTERQTYDQPTSKDRADSKQRTS